MSIPPAPPRGAFVNHDAAFFLYAGDSSFDVVNTESNVLDALAVFSNVFADRAIIVFGNINKKLKQSFAARNEYGFYALFGNRFFTSAFQTENFGVEFLDTSKSLQAIPTWSTQITLNIFNSSLKN